MANEDERTVLRLRRESLLAFQEETGLNYSILEGTLKQLTNLTGELTMAEDERGLMVSVRDIEGASRTIIQLPKGGGRYFDLFRDHFRKIADIPEVDSPLQEGTFILFFGVGCSMAIDNSARSITMKTFVPNQTPQEHMEALLNQLNKKGRY